MTRRARKHGNLSFIWFKRHNSTTTDNGIATTTTATYTTQPPTLKDSTKNQQGVNCGCFRRLRRRRKKNWRRIDNEKSQNYETIMNNEQEMKDGSVSSSNSDSHDKMSYFYEYSQESSDCAGKMESETMSDENYNNHEQLLYTKNKSNEDEQVPIQTQPTRKRSYRIFRNKKNESEVIEPNQLSLVLPSSKRSKMKNGNKSNVRESMETTPLNPIPHQNEELIQQPPSSSEQASNATHSALFDAIMF